MAKMLIDGILTEKPKPGDGVFRRMSSGFRNRIEPQAEAEFPAEVGRYHLYVSMACPWSHRTTILRALKGLEKIITVTQMLPMAGPDGWQIDAAAHDPTAGVPRDEYLYQVYQRADPSHTGPVTVPVLLDKKACRIVSNDSGDIMRMLNSGFDELAGATPDFYRSDLQQDIDRISTEIYGPVNNGVYRAGFATTQAAYDAAITDLFGKLDELDALLGTRRYLTGKRITEADWRLFTTLVRFDPVYATHFKTDRKRIADYRNLGPYLRDLYQVPGVAATIDMEAIRQHYFLSHRHINPHGIISAGPHQDLSHPHGRGGTAYPA
ncbi:glutathione S-transferase family protein (plasmid) [Phaeobacter inhibens]|uniref:glutathione S-transferase family protein n=1 Tax=Phaeobacter inhibens TaxID=221822 RepID=UPI0021A662B1|nr:glutathione S-transferase family protein [Phaeobacter inhibens]UWR47295.1 glutathione S-transferase family protein [Phaeobacter inhibens]UWR82260.1 glutathione S-transferase family protein [Phaeobacter inhibens]